MLPQPNPLASQPITLVRDWAAIAFRSIRFYLTWKAREYGLNTRFIELAGEVNTAMPDWVISKLTDALNERSLPVKGSRSSGLGDCLQKER